MIPLRDNIPSRRTPIVNYAMIAICTAVFLVQLTESGNPMEPSLVERFGMIPFRISHPGESFELLVDRIPQQTPDGRILVDPRTGQPAYEEIKREAVPAAVPPLLTLLTCTFLHGGWMHFLGNMWFLWIFGDNVEDRLGRLPYLGFYLLGGVAASLSHFVTDPSSTIPTLGASGAIAAVMGSYMVLYPHGRVLALVPIFVFIQFLWLPAPLFLGMWFVLQFVQGIGTVTGGDAAGVAWWAHIGGFALGAVAAWLMHKTHHDRPPVERIVPGSDRTVYAQEFPFRVRRRP